ncbi:hypothetical protein ACU4GD_25685 [Cupriavidus basilensis]
MMTDLIAGQIQMAIETSPSALQRAQRQGQGTFGGDRRAGPVGAYPGVPTLAEAASRATKSPRGSRWY